MTEIVILLKTVFTIGPAGDRNCNISLQYLLLDLLMTEIVILLFTVFTIGPTDDRDCNITVYSIYNWAY